MSAIQFGTDGWRGVIAREFTFVNVAIVTQAIACYLQEQGWVDQGIIVGYDQRFMSHLFAERACEVLAGNGIQALLSTAAAPTPAVADAIVAERLAGAILITASHHLPEYNGIQFIPEYAGAATHDITARIGHLVQEVEALQREVLVMPYQKAVRQGMIVAHQPKHRYQERLLRLVDRAVISGAALRVVIDPMHGAGIGYLEDLLRELQVEVVECLHHRPDPLFGGRRPEPSAEQLAELAERVQAVEADLGIALDGAAERFGIIDPSGVYLTPNEVFALLTDSILRHRRTTFSTIARTVATTHWVDRIAADYDVDVVETPVGFAYIGEEIRQGAGIGGDESGGMTIGQHIPGQDGLLVGLLMLEMIAKTGCTPKRLLEQLRRQYGTLVSRRVDCFASSEQKEQVLQTMREWSSEWFGDWRIKERSQKDGVQWVFTNGAWLLVRPSGTEPVVRLYLEASAESEVEALLEAAVEMLGLTV